MNISTPITETTISPNGVTLIKTYNEKVASDAEKEWGRGARRFQKSSNDGLPDLYYIRIFNGKVYDVEREFSPIF